jgi:xanthine dehydrogenase YagS FAD-binding subunit
MRSFEYARPGSISEAVELVATAEKARFLAGGTNLVDLMKLGVETPELLVDVRRLLSQAVEERADGGLRIGGAVPNSDLAADPLVRERYPAVARALLTGASGQVRNVATTAGNLLQRPRCVYFQDVTRPCNKRVAGSGCPARTGEHRGMAVLGASSACVATHPSDLAVALVAFDAEVEIVGPQGSRSVSLDQLYRLPGEDPRSETSLARGEVVTAVELPPIQCARASRYRKVRDRASFAFALVSAAVAVEVDDGVVTDVRIALGGVAHKPWRAATAEALLRGGPASRRAFDQAMQAELATAEPLRDNAFKVRVARNVAVRLLEEVVG